MVDGLDWGFLPSERGWGLDADWHFDVAAVEVIVLKPQHALLETEFQSVCGLMSLSGHSCLVLSWREKEALN